MAALTRRAKGVPLSLLIAKYFAYAFVLICAAWVVSFTALSASMNAGAVYPANWGAAHAGETAKALQGEGPLDPQSIPTAYRYALFAAGGELLAADMDGAMLEHARELAANGATATETEVTGSAGATYASFELADGTVCVLGSDYLPQFTSPSLRDALPNPQNIMLAAGALGSLAAVALAARRAGRAISRKMAPLAAAAERVSQQDLDFSVEPGGVREVDEVLSAMDRMRSSLKESLEARWDAERRQRDQVAALAHDLKTPLTVVRANAEFVSEEACALASGGALPDEAKFGDIADAAADIAAASERLDSYVGLLIGVSRGGAASLEGRRANARELAAAVEADALALAHAKGVALFASGSDDVAGLEVAGDIGELSRAVANVVSNAVDHASGHVSVRLRAEGSFLEVQVVDDGDGFSPEALERGCERFFQGDASRSGGHHGLGLYIAAEAARAHGGDVLLSNITGEGGAVQGACVIIKIPLA